MKKCNDIGDHDFWASFGYESHSEYWNAYQMSLIDREFAKKQELIDSVDFEFDNEYDDFWDDFGKESHSAYWNAYNMIPFELEVKK